MPIITPPTTGTTLTASYVEFTANVTIAGASEAAATTIVTAAAFTPNGTDSYWIEFFSPQCAAGASDSITFCLYDGAASVGKPGILSGASLEPVVLRRKLTPTNAAHTYSIRAYRATTNGTVAAGVDGVGNLVPGYISITKAL